MSICIVIIVGFILGNPALGNAPSWGNSDDDKGYFQTFFVTTSLLSLSILFFAAGWYRGAYPWTANIHPSLARAPPGIRIESELAVAGKYIPAELIELQGLKHDRDNVKRKLEESDFFDRSEQLTAACDTCAAIWPLDIPKSVLTTITNLYSKTIPLHLKFPINLLGRHLQINPHLLQVYSSLDLNLPF